VLKKRLIIAFIGVALIIFGLGYVVTGNAIRPPVPPGQVVKELVSAIETGNTEEANSFLGFDTKLEEYPDGSKAAIGPSIKAEDFKSFKVTDIKEASDSTAESPHFILNGAFAPKDSGVGVGEVSKTLFVRARKDVGGYWKLYISYSP